MLVAMLKEKLPEDVFNRRVRRVGSRKLDALSKSRTLRELVWSRVCPAVEEHESALGLVKLAAARVSGLMHVSVLKRLTPQLAALVDEYGAFSQELRVAHRVAAEKHVKLESEVRRIEDEIKKETTTLVCTAGAITKLQARRPRESIGIWRDCVLNEGIVSVVGRSYVYCLRLCLCV